MNRDGDDCATVGQAGRPVVFDDLTSSNTTPLIFRIFVLVTNITI